MVTIFAIPKPFHGHIEVIQRNAIQSWIALEECEVILFGNDEGVAEIAAEFDIQHVPDVPVTEYGTPLLNFVFERAQQLARHDIVCYVNADIILLDNLLLAVSRIRFDRFLVVGQRWDVDLDYTWDFGDREWTQQLRNYVTKYGVLHPPGGSDYFVFPRGELGSLPPFAVGRPGWDNWMIYRARKLHFSVIDATPVATVIHQNHSYGHIKHRGSGMWEGPEAEQNRQLMGDPNHRFTLVNVNWVLTSKGLKKHIWFWEFDRLNPFLLALADIEWELTPRGPKRKRILWQLSRLHPFRLVLHLAFYYPRLRSVIMVLQALKQYVRDKIFK